ncbi:MAG: tRNA preQ1(34) S-adenosylmethionine ribosyltransferase-isomerase QueA [Candidatus Saccharimonadales bacterium]
MNLDDYFYELPESAIAHHPPVQRGTSRLLTVNVQNHQISDAMYRDLPDYLSEGDVLILNDTKVLPARLFTTTENGLKRELLLLEKHGKSTDNHEMLVMHKKKLHIGQKLNIHEYVVTVKEIYDNGTARIESDTDIFDIAYIYGEVPLPPYMHRRAEENDVVRYQTEFAKVDGSVAAPTASLNLTPEIRERIEKKGVIVCFLTLHVGLGTFMPIRHSSLHDHTMHSEYFSVPKSTVEVIQYAKRTSHKVFALGTTVTRTLEYNAETILHSTPQSIEGEADIFIYPGYDFKIIDGLITNFHAPKSTVLMMAAAFAGWPLLKESYMHALSHNYNFLSYGDSMLILGATS